MTNQILFKMDIKKIFNSALYFTLRRIIELFSVILAGLSLLLVISLVSYSPDDPNFIFPDNTAIKNFLGSNGSYVSDFFMQSFGLMSFLVPITFFFTSISILTRFSCDLFSDFFYSDI